MRLGSSARRSVMQMKFARPRIVPVSRKTG
jgi:hypothetical protein